MTKQKTLKAPFSLYNLSAIMSGEIQPIIDELIIAENIERMKEAAL